MIFILVLCPCLTFYYVIFVLKQLNTHVNYIIVGQGLAGTVLAHTLLKHNKTIVVIDAPHLSKASKVAAGLYNPVVFKRLVKSWMADELLHCMDVFYPEMEQLLNTKFYFKREIVKPFSEEHEKTLWLKKSKEDIGKYLSPIIEQHFLSEIIYNPIGTAEVIKAGNINPALFIEASRNYFEAEKIVIEEIVDYNSLLVENNNVRYKNIRADKIIFCEGCKATDNPYFGRLPFKLTKGETLTIRIPQLDEQNIESKVINKGVFILSLGNGTYKVGATYEWDDLTELPTEKGKSFLVAQLDKVLKVNYEILNHEAGIRPTVKDRRPLIGLHPQYSALAVFNGLGTKGVMLGPYFAKQLVEFLENNIPLNKEVDIARFKGKSF